MTSIIIVAIACTWNGGDIVFATSIKSSDTSLDRTYDGVSLHIDNLSEFKFHTVVEVEGGSMKQATCQMVKQ